VRRKTVEDAEVSASILQAMYFLSIGLATEVIGALLGVWGGVILAPTLTLALNLDAHNAVGASLAATAFTGLFSFAAHFRQGE